VHFGEVASGAGWGDNNAIAVLGAVPPTRHLASGQLLNTANAETVDETISTINTFTSICITMDGWKKRSCEQGAPLITIIILLPDGTALFWKCVHIDSVHLLFSS
jgi:hypothetical protein